MKKTNLFNGTDNSSPIGVCGQISSLVTTLRGILKDYGGHQVVNELLQNADDAGATTFRILLDKRKQNGWGTSSLLSSSMKDFQGPALYQFCDSTFSNTDFESIQRVSDGLKRGDPLKTGQFGLGFNSVYHLTDCPMFMSGKYCIMFDPSKKYLPCEELGQNNATGLFFDMTKTVRDHKTMEDLYPDQFRPFQNIFGYNGKGKWNPQVETQSSSSGTLFRFPLRNTTVSLASEIKKYCGTENINTIEREVVSSFTDFGGSKLLFLKSVESIQVYVWEENQTNMELVFDAYVDNLSPTIKQQRKALIDSLRVNFHRYNVFSSTDYDERYTNFIKAMKSMNTSVMPQPIYHLSICSRDMTLSTAILREEYLLCSIFGDREDINFVTSDRVQRIQLMLLPIVTVAIRIQSPISNICSGRVFCCLPTPIRSNLCIHIDARWELTRDRNNLVLSESVNIVSDEVMLKSEWNNRIASHLAAVAYARLIQVILSKQFQNMFPHYMISLDYFYQLFPTLESYNSIWNGLVNSFFSMLCNMNHPFWRMIDNADDLKRFPLISDIPYLCVIESKADLDESFMEKCIYNVKFKNSRDIIFIDLPNLHDELQIMRISDSNTAIATATVISQKTSAVNSMLSIFKFGNTKESPAKSPSKSTNTIRSYSKMTVEHLIAVGCQFTVAPLSLLSKIQLFDNTFCELNPSSCRRWLRQHSNQVTENFRKYPDFVDSIVLNLISFVFSDLSNQPNSFVLSDLQNVFLLPVKFYASGKLTSDVITLYSNNNDSFLRIIDFTLSNNSNDFSTTSGLEIMKPTLLKEKQQQVQYNKQMVFIHERVAPIIWNFIDVLGFTRFNSSILISNLSSVLPKELFMKTNISSNSISSDVNILQNLFDKIFSLWQYFESNCIKFSESDVAEISKWAIMLTMNKKLISMNSSRMLLKAPNKTSLFDDEMLRILLVLEIPILSDEFVAYSFNFIPKTEEYIQDLNLVNIVKAIFQVGSTSSCWLNIENAAKDKILQYISSNILSINDTHLRDEVIQLIKHFPIFRKESDSIKYTSLMSHSKWFILPDFEDIEIIFTVDINLDNFLLFPSPDNERLYSLLNVLPFPREEFYLTYVLPQGIWRNLSEEIRYIYFCDIRKHFGLNCNKLVTYENRNICFRELLCNLPLFWYTNPMNKSFEWFPANELIDPRDEFLKLFFVNRLPPTVFQQNVDDIVFLEQIGMQSQITCSILLKCAKEVSSEYLSLKSEYRNKVLNSQYESKLRSLQLKARSITSLFFTNNKDLLNSFKTKDSSSNWLHDFGSCYIAEIWREPPKECVSLLKAELLAMDELVPIKGSVLPTGSVSSFRTYFSAWSSKRVIKDYGMNVPISVVEGMGASVQPTIQDALMQLVFLSKLNPSIFRSWEAMSTSSYYSYDIGTQLKCIYEYLMMYILKSAENVKVIRDNLGIHNASSQLACIYIPADGQLGYFVKPHNCYYDDTIENIPPYVHKIQGVLKFEPMLRDCFGISKLPSLHLIMQWTVDIFHRVQSYSSSKKANNEDLTTIIKLGKLASKIIAHDNSLSIAELRQMKFYLPDRQHILHLSSTSLFYDDAPWLDEKIDKNRLPLLHTDLSAIEMARQLGIRSIRECVVEKIVDIRKLSDMMTLPPLLKRDITLWSKNLISSEFQGALRRAMDHMKITKEQENVNANKNDEVPKGMLFSWVEAYYRLSLLNSAKIECVESIILGYFVQIDGKTIDVTRQNSQSDATHVAIIFDQDKSKQQGLTICVAINPDWIKERNDFFWRKPLLRSFSIQLDRYLGQCLQERSLISEFLTSESSHELKDILSCWQIPISQDFDLSLGKAVSVFTLITPSAQKVFEDVISIDAFQKDEIKWVTLCTSTTILQKGDTVFFEDNQINANEVKFYKYKSQSFTNRKLLQGKLDRLVSSSVTLIAITPEYVTASMPLTSLWIEVKNPFAFDLEATNHSFASMSLEANSPDSVALLEYKPPDENWEKSEEILLSELKRRYDPNNPQSRINSSQLEIEPPGIDSFLILPPDKRALTKVKDNKVPLAHENLLKEVEVGTRKRPGYDLIRIGNFAESENMLQDIAFFHHRLTYPEEFTADRIKLVRQCCGVLRKICVKVFDYDPAYVTLFYEDGATSRFIRQKILINIAPIEKYQRNKKIRDITKDLFVYTYFYGLLIHKLGHLFDVVHGTRHDFFMSEYRCLFIEQWIDLLESQGFDPEDALKQTYSKDHLFDVVL